MLNAFTAPGRFYRGNLHCRSSRSDGDPTPERACAFYREAGYDFVSLTDHLLVGHAARSTAVMSENVTRARLPLEKFAGRWARLVIQDHAGRRAWSNPLHL